MSDHTRPEPQPQPGRVSVTRAVMADLEARERQGITKYGTTLQTFNGRNALVDAYQEGIDLVQYLKQEVLEREVLIARLHEISAEMCENHIGVARALIDQLLGELT